MTNKQLENSTTQQSNHLAPQPLNLSVDKPKVSVIMNCLNCSKYLREAIDSVYAQTYKDWEIIFWDNASTDNSAEIAKSYDERLRYSRSEEIVSLGKARNWAIEKARGELIAFLDCDDIWLPEKLEKQIPLFSKPEVGLVFSNTIFFYEDGTKYRYIITVPPKDEMFRYLIESYCISMDTVIIRRNVLEKVGLFDEHLNLMEDADLFLRIAHDFDLEYIHESLSCYRKHDSSGTFTKTDLFRDEWYFMKEKYSKMYHEFPEAYAPQIKRFEARLDFMLGLRKWKEGNRLEATEYFKSLFRKDRRYFFIFGILIFPSSLYKVLQKVRSLWIRLST